MRRFAIVIFLIITVAGFAWAQVDRGTITGTVSDSTGAVLSGVQVSLTETQTGVRYQGDTTNAMGLYRILNLPIGTYALHFVRDGFKTYDRRGITMSLAQNVTLDVSLQVGNRTETITVTSDAPLLNTEDAVAATTMSGSVIVDLPLSINGGRDVNNFLFTTVPTVSTVAGTPGTVTQIQYISVAGSQTVSHLTMVDGTDSDAGIQGSSVAPGMDAIQQFQVQTSGISAEAAQTGGGAVLYELKSGTNSIHGSAFGFLQNEDFNADYWANNNYLSQCGSDPTCRAPFLRPKQRFFDWGGSAGGPIWKNHTFIFAAYERYKQRDLSVTQNGATVPTAKMLGGDFSELLSAYTTNPNTGSACTTPCPTGQTDTSGNPIYYGAIFNPAVPGSVFPGNVIPSGSISPLSQKVISLYQQAYKPENTSILGNYPSFSGMVMDSYHFDVKLDHNFSEKDHANASYNRYYEDPVEQGGLWSAGTTDGGPLTQSYIQATRGWQMRVGEVHTFSPTLINTFTTAYNYWLRTDVTSSPVNANGIGFPQTSVAVNNFPVINFNSPNIGGEWGIGADKADHLPYYQLRVKDTISWVRGRHVVKFGGEFIAYGANSTGADGWLGYTFSQNTGETLAQYNDTQLSNYVGSGFANFELGDVNSASRTVGGHLHGRRKGLNFFVDDTIKVTPKLTLDASLRWDFNTPWHEINGAWSNFSTTATNSSWPGLTGAYQFLSNGSQTYEVNNDYHLFSPHIGASYQLKSKLVARAAYGYFHIPLGINQWGGAPFAGEASFGYVGTNIMPSTSPLNSIYQWDANPYPGNFLPATHDSNANLVCTWCTPSVDPNKLYLGHTQNWNLGVEYEVAKKTVVDISYVGTRGGHLHDGSNDPRNWATWKELQPVAASGHAGDWITSQATAQAAGVPWYPFMMNTTNGFGGYTAGTALAPFPQIAQYGGILFTDSPIGSSRYNAMVFEVKKQSGMGINADLSYTFQREAGNANRGNGNMAENWGGGDPYQDPYAMNSLKSLISPNDVKNQFKGFITYALPFGPGRRWASGNNPIVSRLVGGWTIGGLFNYHGGQPISAVRTNYGIGGWNNLFADVSGQPGSFKKPHDLNLQDITASPVAFNTSLFSNQTVGNLGNQPAFWDSWRGWAYFNEDASIVKKFSFGSDNRFKASIRGEFYNVLNRHHYNNPDTGSTGDSQFGYVTGVWGAPREGQIGARFEW